MYKYPLALSFPAFSASPQITVKDAQGKFTDAEKMILINSVL